MKRLSVFACLLFIACVLFTCTESERKQITRYGSVTGLREDHLAAYKKLHKELWPEVSKMIKVCHIQNYSIYLQRIDSAYYLFSYFEYTGNNLEADMKKMANDEATKQWWSLTDPCQLPLPEAAREGRIWTEMEEVFHLD